MNPDLLKFPPQWTQYGALRYAPALTPLLIVFFGRRGDLKRNGKFEHDQIMSWKTSADEYGTPVFAIKPGAD
jgi:hypothetical protein